MIEAIEVGLAKRIQDVIQEIKEVTMPYEKRIVAFSGGMDSTVVLFLCLNALGPEKIQACTVDWGKYFPYHARKNIDFLISYFQVNHQYLPGEEIIETVMRRGPACNLCTRTAKLRTILEFYGRDALIIGGANQSDSWGIRGLKLIRNTYSPLFDFTKEEIFFISRVMNIPIRRIGENRLREGCVLKHLYKPLVTEFQSEAVIQTNSVLLKTLHDYGFESIVANVKIIGPLQKNVGLVNIQPTPEPPLKELLTKRLAQVKEVHSIIWVDQPLTLVFRANPGLFRNPESRHWIEKGKIQPDFVQPVTFRWLPSSNKRLRTFQIVDFCI